MEHSIAPEVNDPLTQVPITIQYLIQSLIYACGFFSPPQESAAYNAVNALQSAYGVRYRYGPASSTLCKFPSAGL